MRTSRVVLFGAGLVAPPLVRYLLDRDDLSLTIATLEPAGAVILVAGHPRCRIVPCEISSPAPVRGLVSGNDLVISLLPYSLHLHVARACLAEGKSLLTTSYISPAMRELDREARDKGLLFLNEIGLDPGLDHLAAMSIIDRVHARGGRVESFRSYCGGLPSPEANDNPFGYKFSWSPRGVILAGGNPARYLAQGRVVEVPGEKLFAHRFPIAIPGAGDLEYYPNRDSLGYLDRYGIPGAATMLRATLRYPGWCAIWEQVARLGLASDDTPRHFLGLTKAGWLRASANLAPESPVRPGLARQLGLAENSPVLSALEWLGLFREEPLPLAEASPVDQLSALLKEKLSYRAGERDLIVLHHEFVVVYPSPAPREKITATLIVRGESGGETAMARTVSLPAAIAARLFLEGKISATGVLAPLIPEIYRPVLEELERHGIRFEEKWGPV